MFAINQLVFIQKNLQTSISTFEVHCCAGRPEFALKRNRNCFDAMKPKRDVQTFSEFRDKFH